MVDLWHKAKSAVWDELGEGAASWLAGLQYAARASWLAAAGFHADSCSLRASALTLASMLALVPALAASFAYVRGLGWSGERLETLLLQRATILSPDAVTTVVSWVDHTSIASLGVLGALLAIFSTISLLLSMESSFDEIWGSPHGRGGYRRAADALLLLVFGPMLVALAASSEATLRGSSMMAWLQAFGGFEMLIRFGFAAAWYSLVCAAFVALYMFLPAAPVDRRAAVIGGVLAGVSWQLLQSLYVSFQFGLSSYNAVYGALAQIPMLVFWMWMSWVIVLGGAELVAALQNLRSCAHGYTPVLTGAAARERLALAIVLELTDAAHAMRAAPTLAGLSAALRMPVRSVADLFGMLSAAGLVHTGGENQRQCFLSLSPGRISVERVIGAARGEDVSVQGPERPLVSRVLDSLAQSRHAALGNVTLADLVDPPAAAAGDAAEGEERPGIDTPAAELRGRVTEISAAVRAPAR